MSTAWGWQDPALEVMAERLVEAYLADGPDPAEVADGPSMANWAIFKNVGLPEFLLQESLHVGGWATILAPLTTELETRGFSGLDAMEALTWWDETRKEPARFLRLLAHRALIDTRISKDRKRGEALRLAIGEIASHMSEQRASVRFDRMGWGFTGTVALVPSQRVVRIVLRGSQPCRLVGKDRVCEVSLKGMYAPDKASSQRLKVWLTSHQFVSVGCERRFQVQLAGRVGVGRSGEGRVTGNMTMVIKDEVLTGRIQLEVAYRAPGEPLAIGRATFAMRGSLDEGGGAHATLSPISTSGDKELREGLDKIGAFEGKVALGQAYGTLSLPLFDRVINWRGGGTRS